MYGIEYRNIPNIFDLGGILSVQKVQNYGR